MSHEYQHVSKAYEVRQPEADQTRRVGKKQGRRNGIVNHITASGVHTRIALPKVLSLYKLASDNNPEWSKKSQNGLACAKTKKLEVRGRLGCMFTAIVLATINGAPAIQQPYTGDSFEIPGSQSKVLKRVRATNDGGGNYSCDFTITQELELQGPPPGGTVPISDIRIVLVFDESAKCIRAKTPPAQWHGTLTIGFLCDYDAKPCVVNSSIPKVSIKLVRPAVKASAKYATRAPVKITRSKKLPLMSSVVPAQASGCYTCSCQNGVCTVSTQAKQAPKVRRLTAAARFGAKAAAAHAASNGKFAAKKTTALAPRQNNLRQTRMQLVSTL